MRGSFQLEAITLKDTFYCKAFVLEKKKQTNINQGTSVRHYFTTTCVRTSTCIDKN